MVERWRKGGNEVTREEDIRKKKAQKMQAVETDMSCVACSGTYSPVGSSFIKASLGQIKIMASVPPYISC